MTDQDIGDGGPAYPVADYDYQTFQPKNVVEARRLLSGMSMRDFFAGKAMAAIIQTWPHVESGPATEDRLLAVTAEDAYRFADAMLRARKVTP